MEKFSTSTGRNKKPQISCWASFAAIKARFVHLERDLRPLTAQNGVFLKSSIFYPKVKIPKIAILEPIDFDEKTLSEALETQITL